MLRNRLLALPVLVLALSALVMTGCSDSGGSSTIAADDVEFGKGSIPDAIPSDFPLPRGVVIGSYLVDRVNRRSEVELRVPSEADVVAQFFGIGLVNNGYVVDENTNEGGRWLIKFRRDDLRGEVILSSPGAGITQAVIEVNDV